MRQMVLDLGMGAADVVPTGSYAKELGAYYTDSQVAEFLVRWAIRSADETVLDPSFGGGVFLRAACQRIRTLQGEPGRTVWGVEIDEEVHSRISEKLHDEFRIPGRQLHCSDFFAIRDGGTPQVDVVIGNPPFIRYQRFSGTSRSTALLRAREQGVRLPELTSSWAPFLVHSISKLRHGGRLAMVLPFEVAHAKYARPVLEFLQQQFCEITFLTFRKKLFPDLNETTLLLMADGKGEHSRRFQVRDLAGPGELASISGGARGPKLGGRPMEAKSLASGETRLIEHLIPSRAAQLYSQLRKSGRANALGVVADVSVGYVTGANDFFHLSQAEARRRNIPAALMKRAIIRSRALNGIEFTRGDWRNAADSGAAALLLHIARDDSLTTAIRDYIRDGESRGVSTAYKCRVRSPWFCVPHVRRPDAFLTYMSGESPRLVANSARVVAPNCLHVVQIRDRRVLSARRLSAFWQTSLTQLSVEIEGHPLGGGMLKLEPGEAERVQLPLLTSVDGARVDDLAGELDAMLRSGATAAARAHADRVVLQEGIGLSVRDCRLLWSAASQLRGRRGYKGAHYELS